MFRYILVSIIIALSGSIAFPTAAQTIQYSPEIKFGFRKNEFQIIGRTEQKNYTYRTDKDKHYLDVFSDKLEALAIVELDYIPKSATGIKFMVNNGIITILYQHTNNGICYLYRGDMNQEGKLIQAPAAIDSTRIEGSRNARNESVYNYVMTDQQSKFATYHRIQKNKQEMLHIKLYTAKDESPLTRDILLSTDKGIYPQQFVLNNQGILFFSSYIFANDNNHSSDFVDIFTVDFHKDQFTKHPIPLNGMWIDQMIIKADNNNDAVEYAALYAASRKNNIEGVLTGKLFINEEKAPITSLNKFSESFLNKTSTKRKNKSFDNYTLKDVVVKKDGGILMIAESYYITTRSSVANAGFYSSYYATSPSRSITEYNYGNIAIINFDNAGTILWENIIPKSQQSQEDYGMFSSYAFANTGKYLVFVYNDFTVNKNALTLATIDNTGKVNYKQIKVSDSPYDWIPKYAIQNSAMSLLFPCFKNNTLLYAVMFL